MTGEKLKSIFPVAGHKNKGGGQLVLDRRSIPKVGFSNTNHKAYYARPRMELNGIFWPSVSPAVCRKYVSGDFQKIKDTGRKVIDLINKGWEFYLHETVRITFRV